MSLAPIRAAARIARRQARRAPWRSLLVVVLIALPVAPLATAAVVIKTATPTREERLLDSMGTAPARIEAQSDSFNRHKFEAALPAGSRLIGIKWQSAEEILHGSYVQVVLEEPEVPADVEPVRGMFRLLGGRFPRAPGEAAVTRHVLQRFGIGVGGVLRLRQFPTPLRVVGVAVRPESLDEPLALVGPGTLGADASVPTWLLDVPRGIDPQATLRTLDTPALGAAYVTRSDPVESTDGTVATNASFGMAAVALFGVGLIAAAAFVVGARRQLRTLGLVGAAGGEPRHVKAIVLFGGVTLGLVGSVVGTLLGIAGAFALHPVLDEHIGRLVGPVEVPVPLLVAGIALGTLAGALAAYAPARSAARLSTIDALAGRTPPPRRSGRLARRGMVLAAAGTVIVALATKARSEKAVGGGFIVMLIGFLLAIPLLIDLVGRAAGRLPTALRVAARQTARYGRRTGAAMAAVTLALALPVAVSAYTLSGEARQSRVALLADDQLLLNRPDPYLAGKEPSATLLQSMRTLFPGGVVAPIQPAVRTAGADLAPGQVSAEYVEGGTHEAGKGVVEVVGGELTIGTPELLRALHIPEAITVLDSGKVVGIGRGSTDRGHVTFGVGGALMGGGLQGPGGAQSAQPVEGGTEPARRLLDAVEIPGPGYATDQVPKFLISGPAASRLGLSVGMWSQALARGNGRLTGEQIRQAKNAASRYPGVYVQTAADFMPPTDALLRTVLIGASTAVALAIVAVAVALVAAESRRDHAIMVAVGAGPSIRRRVVGANALLLSLLAAVLAVPAGFIPIVVVQWARTAPYPIVVPWQAIGAVLFVVPLLSGIGAGVVSRQPKAARLLQPIW